VRQPTDWLWNAYCAFITRRLIQLALYRRYRICDFYGIPPTELRDGQEVQQWARY
jgi:hypothetical protein